MGHFYKVLAFLLMISLATKAQIVQAQEREKLFGSWCDDTGYRIDITAQNIRFRDIQMGDPPSGINLEISNGVATYHQDFRESPWPYIGLVACTLRLLGHNAAAETCSGSGYGFTPFAALKRCPQDVIS